MKPDFKHLTFEKYRGKNTFTNMFFLVVVSFRLGLVFHEVAGGGQRRAGGGSPHSGAAAGRRELGPQWNGPDVALREQPLPHYHRQVRPVPGFQLPGEPAGNTLFPGTTPVAFKLRASAAWGRHDSVFFLFVNTRCSYTYRRRKAATRRTRKKTRGKRSHQAPQMPPTKTPLKTAAGKWTLQVLQVGGGQCLCAVFANLLNVSSLNK